MVVTPKHKIEPADALAESVHVGAPIVVVAVVIHPFESVTVTV